MSFNLTKIVNVDDLPRRGGGRKGSSQYSEVIEKLYQIWNDNGGADNQSKIPYQTMEIDETPHHVSIISQIRNVLKGQYPDLYLETILNFEEQDGKRVTITRSNKNGKEVTEDKVNAILMRLTNIKPKRGVKKNKSEKTPSGRAKETVEE